MKQLNFMIVISIMLLLTTITYTQQQQKSDGTHSLKQNIPAKSETIQKKNEKQKVSVKKTDQEKSEQKDSISKNELSQSQLLGIDLVRNTVLDAVGLGDKRQAALIQAKAADLLWSYDELVAKELFGSAFESGTNYCLDIKESGQGKIGANTGLDRSGVLLEIIRLINKHDAELARIYTDKYIDVKNKMPPPNTPGAAKTTESLNRLLGDKQSAASGLWNAALSILNLGANTKTSLEIADRALAMALTPEAIIYMRQLADKDRQSADQFYAQALKRMRSDPIPSPGQLTVLADYPFGTGMVRLIDGQSNLGVRYPVSASTALNPELINQFLATAYIVLMRVAVLGDLQQPDNLSRLNTAFYLAKYLEPKVLKFQPGLLDQWRAMALQLTPTSGEKIRQNLETSAEQDALPREQRQSNSQDDVNNILERAEKATNTSQRDFLYGQAALSATRAGEFEKAQEIAGKLADLSIRRRLNSWISFSAAEHALKSRKWDEARSYTTEVEAVDERAYLFLGLATAIQKEGKGKDKDTEVVAKLLEEAFSLALASDSKPVKVKVLIGVSNGFAESDFVRSYEVLQAALNTANQLSNESELLDGTNFVRVIDLGRGPITESKTFEGGDLGKTIVNLARHDSESSLSLLNTLTNIPLRCSATLTFADYLLHSATENKGKLRSEK